MKIEEETRLLLVRCQCRTVACFEMYVLIKDILPFSVTFSSKRRYILIIKQNLFLICLFNYWGSNGNNSCCTTPFRLFTEPQYEQMTWNLLYGAMTDDIFSHSDCIINISRIQVVSLSCTLTHDISGCDNNHKIKVISIFLKRKRDTIFTQGVSFISSTILTYRRLLHFIIKDNKSRSWICVSVRVFLVVM